MLWGIYLLTFISQVLSAGLYWLNNPGAPWQIFATMVIMALQGTLIGGAIKLLSKKLDSMSKAYETQKAAKMDTETDNKLIGQENQRLKSYTTTLEAENLKLKKELYNTP